MSMIQSVGSGKGDMKQVPLSPTAKSEANLFNSKRGSLAMANRVQQQQKPRLASAVAPQKKEGTTRGPSRNVLINNPSGVLTSGLNFS